MSTQVQQQPAHHAVQPRQRPAWWDLILSLGWLLFVIHVAIFEGFLLGEREPE